MVQKIPPVAGDTCLLRSPGFLLFKCLQSVPLLASIAYIRGPALVFAASPRACAASGPGSDFWRTAPRMTGTDRQ